MYKLSKTSKMPGASFSLPAQFCKMGSVLSGIPNSVCSKCYAKKGSYCYPNVKKPRLDNYKEYMSDPTMFQHKVGHLIQAQYLTDGIPFFRWFDSGDLIDESMFHQIVYIAQRYHHIHFWLPTKELKIVKDCLKIWKYEIPSNLTIRVSAYMIDGDYFNLTEKEEDCIVQSRVISKDTEPMDSEIVCNLNCVSCNYACWKSFKNIAYRKH